MKNSVKPHAARDGGKRTELDSYALDLGRIGEPRPPANAPHLRTRISEFDLQKATGPLRAPFNPVRALSERISSLTALLPMSREAKQDLFEVRVNIQGNSAAMADKIALADICMSKKNFVMATKLLCPPEDVKDLWTLYSRSIQLYYEPILGIRNENGDPLFDYHGDYPPFAKVITDPVDYTSEIFTKYTYPRRLDCDGRKNVP